MHALTFHGKQTVKFESVPDPKIVNPTDVIVKVELAGICGSDLHPYHEREKGLDHGTVMGHEFIGEIIEIGKAVATLKKGQPVFCPFTTNCGRCFYCRQGLTCRCTAGQLFGWVEKGTGLHGGQAEYVRVPLAESSLMRIPDNILPEEALLLGDILSTGFFCAENAEVSSGGVYAVIGCGPVGIMATIATIERGAEQVFAIDSIPERLNLATDFGAIAVNYERENTREILEAATEGRGPDAVLEVVGNAAAGATAYELVRPGGIISTAGFHTEKYISFSPGQAYDKNLTYRNGRCPARKYMETLLPVVQSRKYDFSKIISHRLPLSRGARGYEIFDRKLDGCTKVVLSC